MFERFTDRARRAVVLAQEEARLQNHDYIGTEHILLGLIHETNGLAADVLREFEISLDMVRLKVTEIVGRGGEPPTGHIPFTRRAKKVLELSLREALTLGHEYIGTEHILLGLIREGEGTGYKVLVAAGVDLDRVRQATISRATQAGPEGEGGTRSGTGFGSGTFSAIEERLARIEQRLGIQLVTSASEVSRRLSQVRRERIAADRAQDTDRAAELRTQEQQLITERLTALREQRDPETVTPLVDELSQARAEIARLTELLKAHGIDPGQAQAAGGC